MFLEGVVLRQVHAGGAGQEEPGLHGTRQAKRGGDVEDGGVVGVAEHNARDDRANFACRGQGDGGGCT